MSDMIIQISVNAAGLKKGVDEAQTKLKQVPDKKVTKLEGDAKGLGDAIVLIQRQLLSLAAGAFAASQVWQGITSVIGLSITEAKEATIAQRLLQSQLVATGGAAGYSAEELIKISGELQKISNMGDDAIIQNLTVPLTTFRNISGEVFERTQKAILDLNAVFGDPDNPASLRSISIQVGKALNDPIQGLTALRRTGVSFTDSQTATIRNLAETNQLAAAQGLILEELQKQFGGAAESTINSSLQMKNAYGDYLQELGERTLPILDAVNLSFANFWTVMAANMDGYADHQTDVQRDMFRKWNDFTTAFVLNGNAMGAFIIHLGSVISGAMEMAFTAPRTALTTFAKTIWDVLNKLPRGVMEALSLGDLETLKALGTGIGNHYKQVGTDVNVFVQTMNAELKAAFAGFANYRKDFDAITGSSQASYEKMVEMQTNLRDKMDSEDSIGSSGLTPGSQVISRAQTEYQKLLDAMNGYLRDNELARMSAYGKELAQLGDKYAAEAQVIAGALDAKEIYQETHDAKMLELNQIYSDKTRMVLDKVNAEILADVEAREQEEIKLAAEAKLKKLVDEETYYNTMKFMDANYYEWKLQRIKDEIEALNISAEQKAELLRKQKEDLEAEMGDANLAETQSGQQSSWFFHDVLGFDPDNPEDQQKVQAIQTTYNNIVQGAQAMVSQLMSLNRQRQNEDLMRIEETAQREGKSNEWLLAEKKKVNEKWAKEEKKLRNIQKAISITQTIINTAEGVSAALKWGIPLGPIFAAVIGAMGAVQVGLIAAQKYASGGLFKGKGGPRDDSNIIAVSDGEYIVNAESTKRWKGLLDAINYGSSNSQTVARYAYATGGIVNVPSNIDTRSELRQILNKLDVLNLNLVKKKMNVSIKAEAGVDALIRNIDETKMRMERSGYIQPV